MQGVRELTITDNVRKKVCMVDVSECRIGKRDDYYIKMDFVYVLFLGDYIDKVQ